MRLNLWIWEEIEKDNDQGTLGLLTTSDERWTVARITHQGRERMAELVPDHSSDWQGLGVSILHRLIIDDLLATGGTARAACQLIEVAGGIVAGVGVLIELEGLQCREALAPYICESVLTY